MGLDEFVRIVRPAIENEIKRVVGKNLPAAQPELGTMMAYHLGWEGEGAGVEAQGKRVRPLLVLLAAASAGDDWQKALPAAAAVELVHNFSLIHDDIQDQSRLRRGRSTVWVKWGIPQAINAGDVMFTLAHQAVYDLAANLPAVSVLEVGQLLDETCIKLTEGQYLDMANENRREVSLTDYWQMIAGKTAALIGCCTELGALVSNADSHSRRAYRQFGISLGLAFQVLDDWLGIWGDSALMGKSSESDLVTRKKTLPVVLGLGKNGRFAQHWHSEKEIFPGDVPGLVKLLEEEGVQAEVLQKADALTAEAYQALADTGGVNEAAVSLRELAQNLLNRKY